MTGYLLHRLLLAVPTLFGITLVAFAIIHMAPGDPLGGVEPGARAVVSPEARERMREVWHLDEPVWRQYLLWIGGLLRGDLGVSMWDGEPVARKIARRLPATVLLGAASMVLAWGLALPFGIASALRPGGRLDTGGGLLFYGLYSVPVFWAALLLQLLFAVHLRWLPLQGLESDAAGALGAAGRIADRLWHLVLPAVCLAYGQLAYITRFVRSGLLEALETDYARTARSKGLSERAVAIRHSLPNALLPLITLFGFALPALAGGAVIVERIFSWPGVGRLLLDSIQRRDLTTLMGLTLLGAVLTLAGILVADLLYGLADPRVRYGRDGAAPRRRTAGGSS